MIWETVRLHLIQQVNVKWWWEHTQKWQDNNHKVKDVPGLSEVVMSQADDLDHALKGENSREEDVENVQDVGDVISHFVMVDSHSYHVQEYHNHYA